PTSSRRHADVSARGASAGLPSTISRPLTSKRTAPEYGRRWLSRELWPSPRATRLARCGAGIPLSRDTRAGPANPQRAGQGEAATGRPPRSEEHTSELQSLAYLVC